MNPGDNRAPEAERLGLTPKLLTAGAVLALCVTGLVSHRDADPLPTSAPVAPAAPVPSTAVTPAPALQVPSAAASQASVWSSTTAPAPATPKLAAVATWSDIPIAAQAAYQRAATVIDSADPTCHLDWSLLAGIGKVESDHGRTGGGQLSPTGVVTPALIGVTLDGTNGTAVVTDTDGGSFDGDTTYDHAVGPMQFLPATWTTVGVDADGDGQRNPQDIDDAALAAAVYLCSGTEDLADPAGQRAAVFSYNHSESYVGLVLSDAASYATGFGTGATVLGASSLDVGSVITTAENVPARAASTTATRKKAKKAIKAVVAAAATKPAGSKPAAHTDGAQATKPTNPATPTDPTTPTDPSTPTDPTDPPTTGEPGDQPGDGGTDCSTDPTDPTGDSTDDATGTPPEDGVTDPADDTCTDPSTPADPTDPGDQPSDGASSGSTAARTEDSGN